MRILAPLLLASSLGGCCSTFGPSSFEERRPDGTLARRGQLECGRQVGPWTYHHANGAKESEGSYRDDRRVGTWSFWYADGTPRMRGAFEGERREGPWESWNEDGSSRARGRFERGAETGPWEFFDERGALAARGDFDRGLRTGRWTTYADGEPRSEGTYLDGEKIGPWRFGIGTPDERAFEFPLPDGVRLVRETWTPGGAPRREGVLRDGRPWGLWVSFHPNGRRRCEGRFEGGVPSGSFRAFDAEGRAFAEGPVRDGRPTGAWRLAQGGALAPFDATGAEPVAASGAWSPADVTGDGEPARVVAAWVADLASPPDPARIVAASAPSPSPEDRDALEAQTARPEAPILPQPWTERERLNLRSFVRWFQHGSTGVTFAGGYEGAGRQGPRFDREKARAIQGERLPKRTYWSVSGRRESLEVFERLGRKVVVVLLRGYAAGVCVYCTAQTEALAQARADFAALDAEVVVIYPGPRNGLEAFLDAYRKTFQAELPPYRILYDEDVELARTLGLEQDLAQPTTFVLDRRGRVHRAFIGRRPQDRPPVSQILEALRDADARP